MAYGQAALPGNFGVPTGTVTFSDGAISLAQTTPAGGLASFSTTGLASGTHVLRASYSGDATYAAALSNTLTVVVDPQPTLILLQVSPLIAPFRTALALQATVSAPFGLLSGTVQFFDGATQIGTGAVDSSGNAHFTTNLLSLGTHTLMARFPATVSFAASDSNGVQVAITGVPTTTVLTTTPNPSYPGQNVTLRATLYAAISSQALAGAVRFFDGNNALGDVTLNANGVASLAVSTFAVGTHDLTASYLASNPLLGSQSNPVQQVVLNSSFTLAVEPSEITLQTQHHTTVSLKITPVGIFNGVVTLGCGVLPQHATCLLKPQSVTLTAAGGSQSASVYLDTSDVIGYAGNGSAPLSRGNEERFCAVFLIPLLAGCGLARRRTRFRGRASFLFVTTSMVFLALAATGCSGKYPASVAPGSYTLTFTGSSGNQPLQTTSLQWTVTP